jgi:uncharacterized protein with HEPN domain
MSDEAAFERYIGRLVDMLENARLAVARVRGLACERFTSDPTLCDAVIYRLGIVGEASSQVSEATRQLLAEIPWRQIRSMRNILFHDYKGVELHHVWDVAQVHAPQLIRAIEQFLTARGIQNSGDPSPGTPA